MCVDEDTKGVSPWVQIDTHPWLSRNKLQKNADFSCQQSLISLVLPLIDLVMSPPQEFLHNKCYKKKKKLEKTASTSASPTT